MTSAATDTVHLQPDPSSTAVARRLLASSALMLFLELALIRWLGANVIHLSYFSNFVLLGSFLGIGLGFLLSRSERSVWPYSLPLLAVLVVLVRVFPVTIQRDGADLIYFTAMRVGGPPAWLALPVVFVLTAAVLAGPAELVGRCFGRLPPLTAYRWDLLGSLLGIIGFSLLSFLRAPSLVWGVVAALVYLGLSAGRRQRIVAGGAALAVVLTLLIESLGAGVSWSPYYKIETEKAAGAADVTLIKANGVPHQSMAPAAWRLADGGGIYRAPYERTAGNSLDNVLIIGAGSGSDVAIARKMGAKHVDAVDIDPRILQIGRQTNPDRAYDGDVVTQHTDDGRAFLQRSDTRYDLILFALPDSLTLVNGASRSGSSRSCSPARRWSPCAST